MWFTFSQNNSGGRFHYDAKAGIANYVIVEGRDASDANARAQDIGLYFNGCDSGKDCDCCGDRWYPVSKSDADKQPMIYGTPIEKYDCMKLIKDGYYEVFLHPLKGKIRGKFKK